MNWFRFIIGMYVCLFSLIYALFVGTYFGWNWVPKSADELNCGGISIVITSIGLAVVALSVKSKNL